MKLKLITLVHPFPKWSVSTMVLVMTVLGFVELKCIGLPGMKWSKSGLLDKKVLARPRLNHDQRIAPHDTAKPNQSHPNPN